MFTYRRWLRRRLQTRLNPLLGLIYCRRLRRSATIDGRPHIMSAFGADIFSCFVYKLPSICSDAGATAGGPGAAADPHNYCYTYAVLREKPGARRLTVCGRRDRHAVVYTSLSNSVQVRIIRPRLATDDSASYFLLEYQGLISNRLPLIRSPECFADFGARANRFLF